MVVVAVVGIILQRRGHEPCPAQGLGLVAIPNLIESDEKTVLVAAQAGDRELAFFTRLNCAKRLADGEALLHVVGRRIHHDLPLHAVGLDDSTNLQIWHAGY